MSHSELLLRGVTEGTARPDAWERQAKETHRAYMAFATYRDLGPRRSLRKAAAAFYGGTEPRQKWGESGAIPTQVERWSSRHRWVSRATAWDTYVDQERRSAHIEAVREMEARHVRIALQVQAKALEALELLDLSKFKPADVLRFLVEGIKLERLALGLTARHEETTDRDGDSTLNVTVNNFMSDDERDQLCEQLVELAIQEIVREESLRGEVHASSSSASANGMASDSPETDQPDASWS